MGLFTMLPNISRMANSNVAICTHLGTPQFLAPGSEIRVINSSKSRASLPIKPLIKSLITGQLALFMFGWPTETPSAPSAERTRQRKLFLSRSNSMVLMIIGEVNSPLFNTGCLRISSSVAYLDVRSGGEPRAFGSDPQDDKGIVVAAIPPATAVEINLRLFVFILILIFHLHVKKA